MWSPPHSPAATATATATATVTTTSLLSPSTTMPRMSFSLRPSPSRPVSQPWPASDSDALLFSGDVWLPSEQSFFSIGLGSKWTKTPLVLWLGHVVDGASAPPLLHVRLGDRAVVVVTGIRNPRTMSTECGLKNRAANENPQDKKQIVLDVKAPEDVRRAVMYHTAAVSSTLSLYVDTDAARDHLVDMMHRKLVSSPPHSIRPPSPGGSTSPLPKSTTNSVHNAFAMLEIARAKQQRGHVVDALAAFAAADRALATVDTRARVTVDGCAHGSALPTRILHARREIRAAIDILEMEKALPRAAVSVATTTVVVSDPPPATQATSSTSTTIDARLVDLQVFAHGRDVNRAQREHRVAADDLTLRFQALRNEKPTAPTMENLHERLERLRGPPMATPTSVDGIARTTSASTPSTKLSPVDQIIQQAMDEVALGIVDDDHVEDDNASHSTRSSVDSDSSACESESDSDNDARRSRRLRRHRP